MKFDQRSNSSYSGHIQPGFFIRGWYDGGMSTDPDHLWFRFSLRTLLLAMSAGCVAAALIRAGGERGMSQTIGYAFVLPVAFGLFVGEAFPKRKGPNYSISVFLPTIVVTVVSGWFVFQDPISMAARLQEWYPTVARCARFLPFAVLIASQAALVAQILKRT